MKESLATRAYRADLLIPQIRKEFGEMWKQNDPAHREQHFLDVYSTAMIIQTRVKDIEYDPIAIVFAAYFHDLFAWSREDHHERSHQFMLDTDHPLIRDNMTDFTREWVALACREHRASFKGQFSSTFTALINAADRGLPGNVPLMIDRAVKFREHRHPEMSADECMAGAIQHIKEKYGRNGYARYPEIYNRAFAEELALQRQAIDLL